MECILCKNNTDKLIATKLRAGEEIPVYHCEVCDFGMLDTSHPDYKAIDYNGEYNKIGRLGLDKAATLEELFEANLPFQEDRKRVVGNIINTIYKATEYSPIDLLEVGCSVGMFIFEIEKGIRRADGIDLDEASVLFADKKCRGTILTEIQATLRWGPLLRSSYSIFCCFQTLEHIISPFDFLKHYIDNYLATSGSICIEVPNLHDALIWVYDLPGHQQFYYHRAHLWYFTEKSLIKLMELLGFEGKVENVQDYGWFNHMNWVINDKPMPDSTEYLSKPALPFRPKTGLSTPKLKSSRYAIREFWKKVDKDYRGLLCKQGVGSNLIYTGRRRL